MEPSGALDINGNLHVAYRRVLPSVNNWDVRIVKSTNGGGSFGTPLVLDSVDMNDQPEVCMDVAGGIDVVWSNNGLRFRRSTNGGANFSNSHLTGAGRKRIGSDHRGNLYICCDNNWVSFTRTNVLVDVEQDGALPQVSELLQDYPNSFNSSTEFRFNLLQAAEVSLTIHDLLGRRITRLVNDHRDAGYYGATWSGMNDNGEPVSSGVYMARLVVRNNRVSAPLTKTTMILVIR